MWMYGSQWEALQLHAVYKKPYFFYYKLPENLYRYYKSRKNPYLRLKCNEIEALYDKIIITIVPSYTRKNITHLLTIQMARDIFRYSIVL